MNESLGEVYVKDCFDIAGDNNGYCPNFKCQKRGVTCHVKNKKEAAKFAAHWRKTLKGRTWEQYVNDCSKKYGVLGK